MRSFLSPERSPDPAYLSMGVGQIPSNREIREELKSNNIMYQSILQGQGESPEEVLEVLDATLRAYSEEAEEGVSRNPFCRIEGFKEIESILEDTEEAIENAGEEIDYWEVNQRKNNHRGLSSAFQYLDQRGIPIQAVVDLPREHNDIRVGFHSTPQGVNYGVADIYGRTEDGPLTDEESYDELAFEVGSEIDEELRRKKVI